ncbi:MAG: hypothetical protein CVU22_14935 [Betaproteobacteria bacterium HGW-Betaproteobacteria-16]|nr:MAG: hypothetical protein CVU22_14935 [Betaproteobacteria bacterium HGW-Betaproteobacteria-16]
MSKKKLVTRSVRRIGYAQLNVSINVAANASQDEIREAAISAAENKEFSEYRWEYVLTTDGPPPDMHDLELLLSLYGRLSAIGFGSDEPIDGADLVDQIGELYIETELRLQAAGVLTDEEQIASWGSN